MSTEPWYKDGLRFECTQCGACCSGEPGFVWIDEQEIKAIAEVLDMERDDFLNRFARKVGERYSLVEYPDGDCIFLHPESRHCLVYQARPIQCRTWPFWDSNIETPQDWKSTCEKCPGSGTGRLYSIEEITQRSSQKSL
jgi:Fe-S-cluster containining protein